MCAFKDFEEYSNSLPIAQKKALMIVHNAVKKKYPFALEAMSYGVPAFKINGKNLLIYAAFKEHVGIYPTPKAINHFKEELKEYKTSKGTIQFPLNKPLPIELIMKITNWCYEQI